MNTEQAVRRLRERGLVQMGPTGRWEPTRQGRELVAEMELLGEMVEAAREWDEPRGMMSEDRRAGRAEEVIAHEAAR